MIDTDIIRNKVLLLAMRGKLVEQNQSDEPANILISRICEEINGQTYTEDFSEDEIPFGIPMNWKWCRLFDIGSTNIGLTYHPEDIVEDGTIVIRSNNIVNGKMDYSDLVKVNCPIRENQYLNKNDIVICVRNGSKALVGKCAIFNGDSKEVSFGAFMAVLRTPCYKYAYYYLNTPVFRRYFNNDDTKQINQVTQNILKNALIPLPPINEQCRIVDKVDKIFNVLDTIDELQSRYSSDVEVLKNKLIDAGIQGKLTEQLSEDGTAEKLYNLIQEEKKILIKEGKIKKIKMIPIADEDIPFVIPNNWKWVRWGDISESIQYGYSAPAKNMGRIKMVRISDIQDNKVLWDSVPYCDIEEEDIQTYLLHENDILFARTGGTVGKSYIVSEIPEEAIYAGYLIRTSYSTRLCAKYMKYFMESRLYWKQLQNGTIATAQPNCNGQTLSRMMLPLPPVNEQQRIVNRIDEVFRILDVIDRVQKQKSI